MITERIEDMVSERSDLIDRINLMLTAITTPAYARLSPVDQNLMAEQLLWMRKYHHILNKRILRAQRLGRAVTSRVNE